MTSGPLSFNPSDLPSDKNICTPFPMPTMSGLHVGAPIAAIVASPDVSCVPNVAPMETPLPRPTPERIQPTPHPQLTPTRRAAPSSGTGDPKLKRPPLDWRVSGPFPQTLFLGCSVVDFNVSLGWGSNEGASLTVNLIRDPMPTFTMSASSIADKSARYAGMDYAALKNAAIGVKDTPNHYYNVMKPPRALVESLQAALAALPPNYTEAQYRAVMERHAWNPPAQFSDINGGPIIPGKLYYEYDRNTNTYVQKYWLGGDPGFIGDKDFTYNNDGTINYLNDFEYEGMRGWNINIIGAPVRFVVDEFVFCGIVTDWRKSISSGGTQYTVTMQTPTHLLRNAKLILGHYGGSVFTKNTALPVVAPAAKSDYDGSIPLTPWEQFYKTTYPNAFASFTRTYKSYISGPVNISDTFVGDQASYNFFMNNSWQGDIKNDGNLPNVINIYGFLESLGPGFFGGSRQNDLGIKYNMIIGTLGAMLNVPHYSPFNPFGGLVGNSAEPPFKKPTDPPTDHNWLEVFNIADCPTVIDTVTVPDPAVALGNVAGADSPSLKNVAASYRTSTYGGVKKIFDFGLVAPQLLVTTNTYKQLYNLDLTELPVLPDLLRYSNQDSSSAIMSIADFIDDVCDKAGCDYFWEMLVLPASIVIGSGFSGTMNILKIRTVSRKTQPPETAIEDYLKGFVGAKTQLDYGKEFNAEAKTRSMYIGGQQKRLIQVKNFRLGRSQTVHIYSPITKRFAILDVKEKNKMRIPNVGSTRNPLNLIRGAENTNLNEVSTAFFADDTNWRTTNYGGSITSASAPAGSEPQTDDKDENPAVRYTAESGKLATARIRAGMVTSSESAWVYMGNYLVSSTSSINRYKDIVAFKTKLSSLSTINPKKTFLDMILRAVHVNFANIGGVVLAQAQLAVNAVRRWFGMRVLNRPWTIPGPKPEYTNVYADSDTGNIGVQSLNSKTKIRERITAINRFFPLMHDVICPYFGSINYLPTDGLGNAYNNAGYIESPRPVWYDRWTNQIVIVFNVSDLPRTRMILKGTYANGTSFVVTESELRAASRGFDSWIAYLSARLYKPDIVHMIKKYLCPLAADPIPVLNEPPIQANQAPVNPNRQNDPVAARADAPAVQQDGGAGNQVPTSAYIYDMDNLNECDYCKIFMALFHMPKINMANGSVLGATPPLNLKAGVAGAFYDDANILWKFFQNIAERFYGRQFMVKLPMVRTYIDKNVYIIDDGFNNSLLYNNTMRIMEGDGKIYSNYKISPQGAWEEVGNMIDDQMVIGGWYANIFQNDQGLIEPILGFWSSMNFDYESYFICKLLGDSVVTDPQKTKGAIFKMADFVHTRQVCLDQIAGTTGNDVNDNAPINPANPVNFNR